MACTPLRCGELLPGFIKADPRNLPKVDILMVIDHFQKQRHPAMKHVKLQRSTGEDYGDDAVGYVQLKRAGDICELHARITPEHKVTSKPYAVVVLVNEAVGEVVEAKCQDCAAAAGGCKHAAALLGWLNRRSAEKSVTSTESYWKKAKLCSVPEEAKTSGLGKFRKRSRSESTQSSECGDFFAQVLERAPQHSTGLLFRHFGPDKDVRSAVCIDRLLHEYLESGAVSHTCNGFLDFCSKAMTPAVCARVRKDTAGQAKSPLWHDVRFGRITASKAYAAAHCRQSGNSCVMSVIGATKLKDNAAMLRGRELEPLVLRSVQKVLGQKILRSGVVIDPAYPALGASPDGITADGRAVIEVKCPATQKAMRRYVCADGSVAAKHTAQVQMLMHMLRVCHGFFCVADPRYEKNGRVAIIKVEYDAAYCEALLSACQKLWKERVFPELARAYGAADV